MDLFGVCGHTVLSITCGLLVTYWERADLLALLYVNFSCVFVTFPYGVLGQIWYLIVSIPDILPLVFLSLYWLIYIFFYFTTQTP